VNFNKLILSDWFATGIAWIILLPFAIGIWHYVKYDKMLWQKADQEWGEIGDGVYQIKDYTGHWNEYNEITYSFTLTYTEDSEDPYFILNYSWKGRLANWNIHMEDEQGNILYKIENLHTFPYKLSQEDRDIVNKTNEFKGQMNIKESIAKRTKKMQMRASFR